MASLRLQELVILNQTCAAIWTLSLFGLVVLYWLQAAF